ncbi:ribosome maturation factor RimM [Amycolatopsis sp. H6(2020)]|nr:ribosome maturation factor RimM [Amycolatopsis sp. H6(2020)]
MRVQAARIGKPHGIRGEVTVQLLTDDPETRFARGEVLILEPDSPLAPSGTLTVAGARWNKSILVLRFEEVSDRNGAEALRNHHLLIDTEEAEETEGYYEHELTGLAVYAVDPEEWARAGEDPARARLGEPVGMVTGLQTLPTQDLLAVTLADGSESLVPFVAEIVPEVDLEAGRIVITPPPGLLELNREDADASRLAAEDGAQDGDAQAGGAQAGGAQDGEPRP